MFIDVTNIIYDCFQGFIKVNDIQFSRTGIEEAPFFGYSLTTIRILMLDSNQIRSISNLNGIFMPKLTYLAMNDNKLTYINLQPRELWPSLLRLYLGNNRLHQMDIPEWYGEIEIEVHNNPWHCNSSWSLVWRCQNATDHYTFAWSYAVVCDSNGTYLLGQLTCASPPALNGTLIIESRKY